LPKTKEIELLLFTEVVIKQFQYYLVNECTIIANNTVMTTSPFVLTDKNTHSHYEIKKQDHILKKLINKPKINYT